MDVVLIVIEIELYLMNSIDDDFQLFKENSSKTARAWRTKIKPSLKKHMDGVCKEVLEKLRYTV